MERKEGIQGEFCCTIFIIRLYLTRGLSLMKLLFLFSLALCSHLPNCLSSTSFLFTSISLSLSVLCVLPLPLCLSALFISVHFCFIFDGSFRSPPPPHPLVSPTLCAPVSPRWIIAQRTVQRMQVPIMSLQRERCCLSQERHSKVKITMTAIIYDIFSKNTSMRLRLK